MMRRLLWLLLPLLAACAGTPRPDPVFNAGPTPAALASGARTLARGAPLQWGGTLERVINLPRRTRLLIRAHPLDGDRRPLTDLPATGRFLLEMSGFLEPRAFPAGLPVTAGGRYGGLVPSPDGRGLVPLLRGERLESWPRPQGGGSGWRIPRVHIGIQGGTGGVGGGIGVTF
ncbi:MAG TPA: hypothetical protein ENJ94_07620 [Gammaproteobacteria bacterium]|nr:hypothetical protein [Gammaproteobacteria bacterium]